MAWSRRRTAIWAYVFGAATLAVGIGVATGAKKLTTKSQTVEVGAGESDAATATCKRGTKAVSGGFNAELDPTDYDPSLLTWASRRTGGREWTSAAASNIGSGDLTSFAYCRDEKLKTRSATKQVAPFSLDSVTARCKEGEKAVSGGFLGEPVFRPLRSFLDGKRAWTVTLFGPAKGDVTAYVYCRKGEGVKKKSAELTLGGGTFDGAEARCARVHRLVSGGFEALQLSAQPIIVESQKVGKRGWEVAAADVSPMSGQSVVVAYAYCEKKTAG